MISVTNALVELIRFLCFNCTKVDICIINISTHFFLLFLQCNMTFILFIAQLILRLVKLCDPL